MGKKVKTKNLDFVWLAGLVFVDKDFVKKVDEYGIEKVLQHCPYKDLTEQEKNSFVQAMSVPRLRAIVEEWWKAYDLARTRGELKKPEAGDEPWHPYPY